MIAGGLLSILAVGGCHHRHCHRDGKMSLEKMEKIAKRIGNKLDFTNEQHTKLKALVNRVYKDLPDYRSKRKAVHEQINVQIANDTFDKVAVDKSIREMEKDVPTMREVVVSALAEFHAILTPEQRLKAAEHMKKHTQDCKK